MTDLLPCYNAHELQHKDSFASSFVACFQRILIFHLLFQDFDVKDLKAGRFTKPPPLLLRVLRVKGEVGSDVTPPGFIWPDWRFWFEETWWKLKEVDLVFTVV